jgi:hypothetical protein
MYWLCLFAKQKRHPRIRVGADDKREYCLEYSSPRLKEKVGMVFATLLVGLWVVSAGGGEEGGCWKVYRNCKFQRWWVLVLMVGVMVVVVVVVAVAMVFRCCELDGWFGGGDRGGKW